MAFASLNKKGHKSVGLHIVCGKCHLFDLVTGTIFDYNDFNPKFLQVISQVTKHLIILRESIVTVSSAFVSSLGTWVNV